LWRRPLYSTGFPGIPDTIHTPLLADKLATFVVSHKNGVIVTGGKVFQVYRDCAEFPETPFANGALILCFRRPQMSGTFQVMTAQSLDGIVIAVRRRQSHWLAFKYCKRAARYRKRRESSVDGIVGGG
jgi:hypothetical protein